MDNQTPPSENQRVIPLPIVIGLGALLLCTILGAGGGLYYSMVPVA